MHASKFEDHYFQAKKSIDVSKASYQLSFANPHNNVCAPLISPNQALSSRACMQQTQFNNNRSLGNHFCMPAPKGHEHTNIANAQLKAGTPLITQASPQQRDHEQNNVANAAPPKV
eukprot:1146653-Pelagomonas_calceolata.AAC.3